MVIKQETTTTVSSAAVACGCGLEERPLLHSVRHRGIFRRLCTTCVLRLHAQSFCPTCFQVYPPIPSNDAVVNCCKCYSSSHSHCVSAGPTSPRSPYVCPLCTNPNIPIFKLKTAKETNVEFNEWNEDFRVIDRDAAKKLLAAAKIASTSMNKAVVAAKSEAERRAKEAALARKRAKEALEQVAYLVVKEKLSKKEAALSVSGSGAGGVGVSSLGIGGANVNILSNGNGNVVGAVDSLVVTEERILDTNRNIDEVDKSTRVLAVPNAVELKENEKISGITAQAVELGAPVNDDHAVMDVNEKASTREVAELMLEGDNGKFDPNNSGTTFELFEDKVLAQLDFFHDNLNQIIRYQQEFEHVQADSTAELSRQIDGNHKELTQRLDSMQLIFSDQLSKIMDFLQKSRDDKKGKGEEMRERTEALVLEQEDHAQKLLPSKQAIMESIIRSLLILADKLWIFGIFLCIFVNFL